MVETAQTPLINKWYEKPYSQRFYEILEKRKTLPMWHQRVILKLMNIQPSATPSPAFITRFFELIIFQTFGNQARPGNLLPGIELVVSVRGDESQNELEILLVLELPVIVLWR